jgi:hypothetical protein
LAFNGRLETVGVGIYMCAPDNFEINGGIDLKKQFSGGDFEQPETEANH